MDGHISAIACKGDGVVVVRAVDKLYVFHREIRCCCCLGGCSSGQGGGVAALGHQRHRRIRDSTRLSCARLRCGRCRHQPSRLFSGERSASRKRGDSKARSRSRSTSRSTSKSQSGNGTNAASRDGRQETHSTNTKLPGTSSKLSLSFFRDSSWRYCSAQLHLATLLACQLLKSHRCVSHVELDIYLFEAHLDILSDALRENQSITSVKLAFSGWINGEDLATAALSLPRLRELEHSGYGQHSPTLVARLSTFLQNTTSLTALRLSKECPKGLSCEDILGGLAQNCSLKELVLPSRLIAEAPPRAQAAFAEWLTNSVLLKNLTVVSHGRESVPLKRILEAILANRSLVAVVFDCPYVYQSNVECVSKIFEENEVLRSLKILHTRDHYSRMPSFVRRYPNKADCDRCLKALIENHTLEEVCLPFDVWDEGQWKELFEALPAKKNFKKLSIQAMRRAPPFLVGRLCAALKETGADKKVSFSTSFTEKEFDERSACKAFSSVVVSARNDNREAVFRILERLPSLGHITCLHLNFEIQVSLDGVLSSFLATFLGATRTLKNLELSASWDMLLYDCQEGLMDGLARNTSLREVRIQVEEVRNNFPAFSEPLANAISTSKNISRVYLGAPDYAERAFFQSLSRGIADNYTLLSVTVLGYRYSKFKRRSGLALERMHSHPELVEEVAKVEEVDQAQAAAMVRDGLRSMEGLHQFMRLAGVVRKQVSCHAREDGRTQLDALNEDCWIAVRRYLKLHDIKESTAEVL
ncbi:hypothetical protein HPB48_014555 [Haemaphysalis longicornis]|uniref:Nlr family card domain protein n=1 Tax=Haemaphysalis longicornis TaxID=44386 RepID=A0A9J6GJX8_HAELO|nr:hypothetical protein HPB48_014555 [Haemaphysalis longicornis]